MGCTWGLQSAKMLLEARDYDCAEEMVMVVAYMAVPQIFMRPKESDMDADTAKAKA